MKRIFALVFALTICLFSVAALAEGKLTVTEKNLIQLDGSDVAYFFAKVENTGDDAIGVGTGKLVAFSADDEVLISEDYVSTSPNAAILQPGESLYVREWLWESALASSDIADYKFSMGTDDYGAPLKFVPCEATVEMNDGYIYITLTNDTEETQYGLYITATLHDAEGNLIFVSDQSVDNVGIHPGSTVTFRMYIDSDVVEYYANAGIEPAAVDAYVCCEAE